MREIERPRIDGLRGVPVAVFFISFAVLGWQLGLMRCLLISRYHHFSFLVISCALLGFGAGGTLLSLAGARFERHLDPFLRWGLFSFALSIPVCFRLGELLPLNVYFPPMILASNIGLWCLFWLIHLVPFLLAGTLIGLALMVGGRNVHLIYGSNLAGSAAGALGGIVLTNYFQPNVLPIPLAIPVLLSGLLLIPSDRPTKREWLYRVPPAAATALLGCLLFTGADRVFPLKIDQYKTLAYAQRLEAQGNAERKRSHFGPRGRIDLFGSPHFHTLLSLGSPEPPPRMDIVLRDGFQAGALPLIERSREAGFIMRTPAALPYELTTPERILILGESGGVYIWPARLSSARSIVVVQPDRNILRVLKDHQSRVLNDPRIRVVVAEPRAFLDHTEGAFDVIHLAGLEGFSAGSGGIGGLREDYLATVEGFAKCLDALTPRGLACVVRGIQDPARDNIKIAATWIEALEHRGIADPGNCLLMARDELGFATLAGRVPLDSDMVKRFIRICDATSLDPEWFPGVSPEETNKVHLLPGPQGKSVSWYHHAMGKLLSKDREDFYENWICRIRPASDDRPYFHDFFRWASVSRLRAAFGPQWPARAEMGFLVLILAAAWTATMSALLLLIPLLLIPFRRARPSRTLSGTLWASAYFGTLGTGFMFLEMGFIQMFTRLLGDPIVAAAMILGGLLLFAGAGSVVQPRLTGKTGARVLTLTLLIAGLVLSDSLLLPLVFREAAMLSGFWKIVLGLVIVAPLALLMGTPFPWGLSVLQKTSTDAIPVAWAVNGFASVVSASVAVIIAMVFGFKTLLILAAALYVLAGLLALTGWRGIVRQH